MTRSKRDKACFLFAWISFRWEIKCQGPFWTLSPFSLTPVSYKKDLLASPHCRSVHTDGNQNLSNLVGKGEYILPMVVLKVDAIHLPAPREVWSRDVPDRPCNGLITCIFFKLVVSVVQKAVDAFESFDKAFRVSSKVVNLRCCCV